MVITTHRTNIYYFLDIPFLSLSLSVRRAQENSVRGFQAGEAYAEQNVVFSRRAAWDLSHRGKSRRAEIATKRNIREKGRTSARLQN